MARTRRGQGIVLMAVFVCSCGDDAVRPGRVEPGGQCGPDAECVPGARCETGICRSEAGGACSEPTAPCLAGLVCERGQCAQARGGPCSETVHCATGLACEGSTCVGGLKSECDAAAPCASSLRCVEGVCAECAAAADCSGGRACKEGLCVVCAAHTDCGQATACRTAPTCHSTLGCVPGAAATNGTSCGSGLVCVGGACRASECGDGWRDAGRSEQCDGADLGGASCATRGHAGGRLACTSSCTFDTIHCIPSCSGDRDCDGFSDAQDNCPIHYNPDQANAELSVRVRIACCANNIYSAAITDALGLGVNAKPATGGDANLGCYGNCDCGGYTCGYSCATYRLPRGALPYTVVPTTQWGGCGYSHIDIFLDDGRQVGTGSPGSPVVLDRTKLRDDPGDACDNCRFEANTDQADFDQSCVPPPYDPGPAGDPVCGDVCQGVTATCGDNSRHPTESCDDGNLRTGDGCGSNCFAEKGCPAGLVGHWTFNIGDMTGRTVHSVVGATVPDGNAAGASRAAGRHMEALSFDGTDDVVTVPHAGAIDLGAAATSFTAEAWVKLDPGGGGTVLDKSDGTKTPFTLTAGGSAVAFLVRDGGAQPTAQLARDLADGAWHLLTGVRDAAADKVRLWIDARMVAEVPDTTAASAQTTAALAVGALSAGGGSFKGAIDEVALYDRALGKVEIEQHWRNGLVGLGHCQMGPAVLCGNGLVEPPEQCDDGNAADGDGCAAICMDEL